MEKIDKEKQDNIKKFFKGKTPVSVGIALKRFLKEYPLVQEFLKNKFFNLFLKYEQKNKYKNIE